MKLLVSDLNVGDQLEIDWDGRMAPVEVIEKGDGGAYIALLRDGEISKDYGESLFLKDDEHLPDADACHLYRCAGIAQRPPKCLIPRRPCRRK